jgi:hypothetical protein
MLDNPNTAEQQKPRRRWFQFRLRTLLVGIVLSAIPCAYVGWQAKMVAARKAMPDEVQDKFIVYATLGDDSKIPAIRRWLGDHAVAAICFYRPSDDTLRRYREAFPESSGQPAMPPNL